jgi:hypothetical protein
MLLKIYYCKITKILEIKFIIFPADLADFRRVQKQIRVNLRNLRDNIFT